MFELNIKSSKDIQKLVIEFADGASTVIKNSKAPELPKRSLKEEFLDTKIKYDKPTFEKEKPPEIKDLNREPKVASELQNLNF